jgi:hypothetical protein
MFFILEFVQKMNKKFEGLYYTKKVILSTKPVLVNAESIYSVYIYQVYSSMLSKLFAIGVIHHFFLKLLGLVLVDPLSRSEIRISHIISKCV